MNPQIKLYYVPKNPNIIKGTIYTLYINNNTNLNLSTIINNERINKASNSIILSKEDYIKLLELNEIANQLTAKRTSDIKSFMDEETKAMTELYKINTERESLIKKLTKQEGKNEWISSNIDTTS